MAVLNMCYKKNEINPLIPWLNLIGMSHVSYIYESSLLYAGVDTVAEPDRHESCL
jgi:hypothetical protein